MTRSLALLPLAIGFALSACGSGGGSTDAGNSTDAGDIVSCQVDSRVVMYSAGMALASADGGMTFTLMESDPAPPADQNNTWTLKIVDGAGNAVTGATLSVVPTMPYMGHGTPIHPEITEVGGGVYSIADINLFMAGIWEVTINASTPSNTSGDVVSWFFCVEG